MLGGGYGSVAAFLCKKRESDDKVLLAATVIWCIIKLSKTEAGRLKWITKTLLKKKL